MTIINGKNDMYACPSDEIIEALTTNNYPEACQIIASNRAFCVRPRAETSDRCSIVQSYLYDALCSRNTVIIDFILSLGVIDENCIKQSLIRYMNYAKTMCDAGVDDFDLDLFQQVLKDKKMIQIRLRIINVSRIIDDLFAEALRIRYLNAAMLLVKCRPGLTADVLRAAVEMGSPELVKQVLSLDNMDKNLKIFRNKRDVDAFLFGKCVDESVIRLFTEQNGFPLIGDEGRPYYCVAVTPVVSPAPTTSLFGKLSSVSKAVVLPVFVNPVSAVCDWTASLFRSPRSATESIAQTRKWQRIITHGSIAALSSVLVANGMKNDDILQITSGIWCGIALGTLCEINFRQMTLS
jgi:hypothetical protein